MCSSQSEAEIASPLRSVRVRRKASNVDFIDGPIDTDEENEKIENLVEAEGDTDFLPPPKVAKKRGRHRKAVKNRNLSKTNDAKTVMNNNDDIAGKESQSTNTTNHESINTINHDTSTESNTSTPSKSMKMARVHEEPPPGSASGSVDPGPDLFKLKSPSILKVDTAGPMIIDPGKYKHLEANSLGMLTTRKLSNCSSVKNKNTTKTENTCIDKIKSVDMGGEPHSMINSSKSDKSIESTTSANVRSKDAMVDFVSAGAEDTDEENDNMEKLIMAENDTDFVPDEGNIVQKNANRVCPGKVAQNENIYKMDDETKMNNDNGTEEQNFTITLSTSDTSTDSNRSFQTKTVARRQRELLHDGSSVSSSPRDSPSPSLSVLSPSVGISSGKSRYEQIRDDIIAERNEQLQAMGFFESLAAAKAEMTSKKSAVKPRLVKAKKAKMKKMSGPRVSGPGPGQYHHRGSQSLGMVRKPGPSPVTGLRMPRRAPSTGLRMPGPAPSAGLRMHGPISVTGQTGIVGRGGYHRGVPSYPPNKKEQNIRPPTPQPEPNVSHYPTQATLSKFSNMGTTLTRKQSPPPASSCGEWNLPPGISISRIQDPDPGTGMTMTSLASALHLLGEREGTRRNISYRLTERQIMALKALGFEQELRI